MVTRRDYDAGSVEAALSVVVEVVHLLGQYRDRIVVVGGWVPKLTMENPEDPHVGSIDVDIALDHRRIEDEAYGTIRELLLSRGYEEGRQPFIFYRRTTIGGREYRVEVDLLAGEYQGTGKKHRTQRVQDARPRKARGCDLAFDDAVEVTVEGGLPGGGRDSVRVRVAAVVPFLVMKSAALANRLKEKDAWDIYYCLVHYPGGLDGLVGELKRHVSHGLVREGLHRIAEQFAFPEAVGPRFVADFDEIQDADDRAIRQRDAYERVRYLMDKLGIE